jgi:hypothetical protein
VGWWENLGLGSTIYAVGCSDFLDQDKTIQQALEILIYALREAVITVVSATWALGFRIVPLTAHQNCDFLCVPAQRQDGGSLSFGGRRAVVNDPWLVEGWRG